MAGNSKYDLAVIGAGPGGYVAAIRAAQLGMRVVCVDKRGPPGGTCLNVGCIPSKALLHDSERYAEAKHDLADRGIIFGELKLDLAKMMARKDKAVRDLTKGVEFLFKKNKVEYVQGTASIPAAGKVKVQLKDGGSATLAAANILIATRVGADPARGCRGR